MYLGTQFAARTDSDYETFKQLGVNNINGFPETPCLLYTSPSPRDRQKSRMPSSA